MASQVLLFLQLFLASSFSIYGNLQLKKILVFCLNLVGISSTIDILSTFGILSIFENLVYNFDFVYISYCLKLVFVFNWNVVYICYIVNILSALSQSVLLLGGCPLFEKIQEGITRYDTHRWTALMTDCARQGLGYVMCQK